MRAGAALLLSLAGLLVAAPAVTAKSPVEVTLDRTEVSTQHRGQLQLRLPGAEHRHRRRCRTWSPT